MIIFKPLFCVSVKPMTKPISSLFCNTSGHNHWPTAAASASRVQPLVPNPLTAISGFWYTEGREGGIQLYPCDDKICGRFYWMKDPKGDR